MCDRPRGSQAVLKASYEEDNGEEEDKHDEMDNKYFTMRDGDNFFATGEESNENQGGADGDNGYNAPIEEGMYLGEEVGICNEEYIIQDKINVMRFSMEEDTELFEEVMHASVKTDSAVSIESQIAMSAVQVQGQHDLDFLTRGDDVGQNTCH